jgi:hypothetical protein
MVEAAKRLVTARDPAPGEFDIELTETSTHSPVNGCDPLGIGDGLAPWD